MTNEELQTVVAAVIQSLKTNGKTIAQLTAVTSLANSDYFEISDGRKVSYEVLIALLSEAIGVDIESIITGIAKVVIQSFSVSATGSSATLTVKQAGYDAKTVTLPVATDNQSGIITAADKVKLDTAYTTANAASSAATAAQQGVDALNGDVYEDAASDVELASSIATSWIANQNNNLGGVTGEKSGWRIEIYPVTAGKRVTLILAGSAGGNQAMAAAFYTSNEIGTSTYLDCALYDEDVRVTATNSYGTWELVVPEGAYYLAVTAFSTTTVTLKEWNAVSKLDEFDARIDEIENNSATELAKVNLFSTANVLPNAIIDGSNGSIGTWDPVARGQYAAVAQIPVTQGKYYAIINPYWNSPIARAGVSRNNGDNPHDYGNTTADNIVFCGQHYAVVQAICWRAQSAVIDTLNFVLYRRANTAPYPIETPLVEVYEMDAASDAIEYIKSRFGEEREVADTLNVSRKILESDFVGTLSSAFNGMSMLVMGDSITANHGWSDYIANKFKWHGIHNIAIGGANIGGPYDANDGTSPRNLIYQMLNAASLLGDVCYTEGDFDETTSTYVKKVDCVFISMGYNDAKNGRANGSLADVKDVAWDTLAPADTETGFASVAAAMKYCLFYMKSNLISGTFTVNGVDVNVALDCRKARFIWQTPIATSNLIGNHTAAETDALLKAEEDVIIEICEYYSVGVINGRLRCGFSREEESLVTGGKYLADTVHPNADGYIKMGEMNTSGLLSNFM